MNSPKKLVTFCEKKPNFVAFFTKKMIIMRYNDLFIDFDDTLYDTHGNAVIALRELYEALHLENHFDCADDFFDAYWRANIELWKSYSLGEISRDYLILERFRRPLCVSRSLKPTDDYCLKASDLFLDLCSTKPGVVDGAHELVEYLRASGYRMHICSNGFHEVQYKKLEACCMLHSFDTIVLSEDAGANKPSRQFFDYALRVTGACRESTLMIGDNLGTDIQGAIDAGIDAAYFNRFPEYPAGLGVKYEVTALQQLMDIL